MKQLTTYLTLVLVIVLLALATILAIRSRSYRVLAPELFGEQSMLYAELPRGHILGLVHGGGLGFVLYGQHHDQDITGQMVQIAGGQVDNYGNTAPIPVRMQFAPSGDHFAGWIHFRGHPRKFCGGVTEIPRNCMLKGE